ncbi:unnamed protein product [Oreochromis niloticus]|nr:unnamed protein product [Mustela putorius furo]
MTLLRDPPAQGKYAALKELLLRRYALSDAERAEQLLNLSGLGGGTALELMENMLSLLGPDDGGFLFVHLFLRQLPAAVRAVLANSPLLPAKDYCSLAEEADRILLASRTFDVHALATDSPAAPSTPPPASPGASAPLLTAGIATRRHRRKSICFYHQRFGDRARRGHFRVYHRHSACGWHDAHRTPLRPPYDGPYRVLKPGNKHFILDFGGRQEVVSVDRLKPAHVMQEDQVVPAQAPRRGRPPATGLMDSVFSPRSDPQSTESESSAAFSDRQCQPRSRAGLPAVSFPPPQFSRSGRLLKPRVLD